MIASKNEPFMSCNRNVCSSSENVDSRIDHGRIGTPFVKKIFGVEMTTSASEVTSEKRINSTLAFIDL